MTYSETDAGPSHGMPYSAVPSAELNYPEPGFSNVQIDGADSFERLGSSFKSYMVGFLIFDVIVAIFGFPFTLLILAIQVLFLVLGYQGVSSRNSSYILAYQVWGILSLVANGLFLFVWVLLFLGLGGFILVALVCSIVYHADPTAIVIGLVILLAVLFFLLLSSCFMFLIFALTVLSFSPSLLSLNV